MPPRQSVTGDKEKHMPHVDPELSTGLPGLDQLFTGLIPGDNIVWQVASVEDYIPFAKAYCNHALRSGKGVIYFRFAEHPPLLKPEPGVVYCELNPKNGFEAFLTGIQRTIESSGHGGCYLFDMLSDLATDWYSDEMLGNFFMLTCPYLYDIGAVAYFGLLQGFHSSEAVDPILRTTQIFSDVFRYKEKLYVYPNKVQQRYSPTMHMLHVRDGDDFHPVAQSAVIAEIMTASTRPELSGANRTRGTVNRTFAQAEAFLADKENSRNPRSPKAAELMRRLLKTCFSRDERILKLLEQYLTPSDAVEVKHRMIGTGLIGGKSVGMLLARAILRKEAPKLDAMLEPHDSFYVGSDVYYSFVVHNGLWWMREPQEDRAVFLDRAKRARRRMLVGTFPEQVVAQLAAMMDYYGQSPIVIRSSSLLEDNFGNAFAGKYESVFCPNQGPRHKRLEDLLTAVRTIYASTLSENALAYREERGLLTRDEQMALLVQRVSGVKHGDLFFPQLAGVGLSYNPYVWNDCIDPASGVLRLVFGLGTRAVDRHDDDYTRVVALNAPDRRPDSSLDELRRYAQRRVDVIDIGANMLRAYDFQIVAAKSTKQMLDMFTSRDTQLERSMRAQDPGGEFCGIITFDKLLRQTPFADDMASILRTLQNAYDSPVDVEFTVNFTSEEHYRINVVQCRPLQVVGLSGKTDLPDVKEEDLLLKTRGAVIGHSRSEEIDRIIYIVPSAYAALSQQQRYAAARLVGRLVHLDKNIEKKRIMLIGPGRWGTTTPSLGVPVKFHEISRASILCEIVTMRDGLVPDVSLGTHFFNDIVETDMLYLALFPGKEDNLIKSAFFENTKNDLGRLLPDEKGSADTVRVFDFNGPNKPVFAADAHSQLALCRYRP
jgi:pyruvate, water dikinase